ncbi:hypothetical protein L204_104415 [Cryptococcus depauperatus]
MNESQAGSSFTAYASRFLANKMGNHNRQAQDSQIFRPESPPSPTHDPFMPSPSVSSTVPYLPGSHSSSRSQSPAQNATRTPPFPGPGINTIPEIDTSIGGSQPKNSNVSTGLLFRGPEDEDDPQRGESLSGGYGGNKGKEHGRIPNPYQSSSDSEEESQGELDLDEVDTIRRSLLRPHPQRDLATERSKKGWLAHQSVFPPSSSSSESESEKRTERSEDGLNGSESEAIAITHKPRINPYNERHNRGTESYLHDTRADATAYNVATNLEEPLLGVANNGREARVPLRLQVYHGKFGHWEREGLRKYKDSGFLSLWLASLLGIFLGLFFVWGSTDPAPGSRPPPSILPLIPLLFVLLIPSLILPPALLFLLHKTVRPVLMTTAAAIPFSLFVCGWWTFGESFKNTSLDGVESEARWWSTTGLRIGAISLWVLAAIFARSIYFRRGKLDRTASVVELSTSFLLSHLPLLILTPFLLSVFALISIPFLTLLIRLGTIGYWRHPKENTWVWHLRPYAGWLIFLVTIAWIWTWGIIRGVGRVAVSGVVGEWYFHREEHNRKGPIDVTTAALHRATGTSLGSICLSSLILATVRTIGRSASTLKRLTSPKYNKLPHFLLWLNHLTPILVLMEGVLDQLNSYALVYVGITGEPFWPSARRAVGLASRRRVGRLLDYTLIKLLLTLGSITMGLFMATAGYLYMAHSLSNPGYALPAGLLCGSLPFMAVGAGCGILTDTADALFICCQIDRDLGEVHSVEAKNAFGGDLRKGHATVVGYPLALPPRGIQLRLVMYILLPLHEQSNKEPSFLLLPSEVITVAQAVCFMVANVQHIEETLFGENEIAKVLQKDARVIIFSTVLVSFRSSTQKGLENLQKSIGLADLPVSG